MTTSIPAKMRPEPEALQAEGELVAELGHEELVDFVKDNFWGRATLVTIVHHVLSLLLVGWLLYEGFVRDMSLGDALARFGLGAIVAFTLLLPVHEAIHGLCYRLLGATDVRWDYQLRRFTLFVLAHRFVAGAREFVLVALAPSIVINGTLLLLALAVPTARFMLLSILFVHHGGTSGDFALVSFVWRHRARRLWTWDDGDAGRTWFYAAREEASARYVEGDIPA